MKTNPKQSNPHQNRKESAMKSILTMVALVATILTLAPQSAWAAFDVKSDMNFKEMTSAKCKKAGLAAKADCETACELGAAGNAAAEQNCKGIVAAAFGNLPDNCGGIPPTDKWCASASKKIPLADPCPPCPDGTKEVKGKCVADPKPIPPPVQDKVCEGSGRKVKPSDPCPVWGIWSQDWIATAETCPADTHEVKADKPACGCDSDELVHIKKPNDGTQCPMKLWVKVLIGIGILLLVLLGLLLIGILSRKKDDKVACPKDPLHPKGVPGSKCQCGETYPAPAKPAATVKCLGKPPHDNVAGADKCITCGAEVPAPPPASKPDEKGGSSLNLEEVDHRIAMALKSDRSLEREQAKAAFFGSLISFSEEHIEGLKTKAETTTDPAEKAAMALAIRAIEILQEHWGMIETDFVKEAEALKKEKAAKEDKQ